MDRTVVDVPVADWIAPATSAGPLAEERWPVLLWVRTGAACVKSTGVTYQLRAGQAIWIPPGVTHATQTDEGALVFPIFPKVENLTGVLAQTQVIDVPNGWEAWLLHQYVGVPNVRNPLMGSDYLMSLVTACSPAGDADDTNTRSLPMPRSPEARSTAQSLLRDLASSLAVEDFARLENLGVKTLRRQFIRETGLTFLAWRTRARLLTAAQHLIEGRSISDARQHVGYATAAGFTKAFHRHFGLSPRDFVRRRARVHHRPPPQPTDEVASQTAAFIAEASKAPPPIPSREIWDQVNDCHVMLCAFLGDITLKIATRTCHLRQGEAMWVPAGVTHSVTFMEGSILFSFGVRYGNVTIDVGDLKVYAFPPDSEAFLLHTRLAETTLFRPENYQNPIINDLFRDQFVTGRGERSTLTGQVGEIATALRRNPANPAALADWAEQMGIAPAQLGQAFLRQTGVTFPKWRSQLRMNIARELLAIGDPPGEVSKRLGYSSTESFTNAFTATHGIPPSQYQRRENGSGTANHSVA